MINLQPIRLSPEDCTLYQEQGFVVFRNAFSGVICQEIVRWAEELAALPEVPGRHWVYHEKSKLNEEDNLICRIEKIQEYHDGFKALNQCLRSGVDQLFNETSVLFKEKLNFKMPGGDGFEPHQDSQAGWEVYASDFVTAMVTIDQATEENGCLKMASGTFDKKVMREWAPLTNEDLAEIDLVPYPTKPGDVVFFDSYTPHSSEPNLSSEIRRIYFATFNKASEGDHLQQYYADKHKNYPPDIERQADKAYVFRV